MDGWKRFALAHLIASYLAMLAPLIPMPGLDPPRWVLSRDLPWLIAAPIGVPIFIAGMCVVVPLGGGGPGPFALIFVAAYLAVLSVMLCALAWISPKRRQRSPHSPPMQRTGGDDAF
jgi:hypothetical protein